MMLLFNRHREPFTMAVRLPPPASVAEFRDRFAERGWVNIDDVLPPASAAPIARAMAEQRLECRASHPHALAAGVPSFMFHERRVRPHRRCRKACAPICALGRSLIDEPLVRFVSELSNGRRLAPQSLNIRAYVKGSHVDCGTHPGVEVLCCVTPAWDAAFGGQMCFAQHTQICPRFGTLYVVGSRREIAVTLVREHGPLVMLSAWFE